MKRLSIAEALRECIRQEMRRDERVFCIGEDIAVCGGWGGAFTVTQGGTTKTYGASAPPTGPAPSDPGSPGIVTGCSQAGGGLAPALLLGVAALPLLARRRSRLKA